MQKQRSSFQRERKFDEQAFTQKIKKAAHVDRSEKEAREGGKVSGKAMQDEVEANAQTLGLEKTTFLEEV